MIEKIALTKASEEQIIDFIKNNDGWSRLENKLHKTFIFSNFAQAFGFMTSIASYAEQKNHHPEWFNMYKTVRVDLTTNDVSGLSERDFCMAKEMDLQASKVR